jgi:sugar lactone lactonase YvrE
VVAISIVAVDRPPPGCRDVPRIGAILAPSVDRLSGRSQMPVRAVTRLALSQVIALVALLVLAGVASVAKASSDGETASGDSSPQRWLGLGEARQFFPLAPGNYPEGIAFGRQGVLYLGNRRDDGEHYVSELLALARDGSVSTLAVLAQLERDGDPGNDGVLGLATDRRGNVYAALVSPDPAAHGVWRITRDGSRRTRLPGSERMIFPNALAFDARGSLYVTDSFGGAVWRFPSTRTRRNHPAPAAGASWVQHELLAPALEDPYEGPLPGANGIVFVWPNHLYVANTEKGLIAHVPIGRNGNAGAPTLVAAGPALATADGVAADARGGLHAVIPGHAALGIAPLVYIDPVTGRTSGIAAAEWTKFDVPLSLTFGAGRHRTSIFATNGDLPGIPPEAHLPGVVEVNAGVPGASLR